MISRQSYIFFFFQAEDGIRDKLVTGVQTCALPIFIAQGRDRASARFLRWMEHLSESPSASPPVCSAFCRRSEERRVGKACRSRRTTARQQKRYFKSSMRRAALRCLALSCIFHISHM